MKSSRHYGELCYPFIHETSTLCDFEMVTDELCTLIGMALSAMPPEMADLAADLDHLQPLAFHVNGSIRGTLAVEEADVQWVVQRLRHYQDELGERQHTFILPRGTVPVPQLHLARSCPKKPFAPWCGSSRRGTPSPTCCRASATPCAICSF